MKTISVKELEKVSDKSLIIDVREVQEWQNGHIKGARNIPMSGITFNYESLIDKTNTYYIICAAGGRSAQVVGFLMSKGYNVINVEGGMQAYAYYVGIER